MNNPTIYFIINNDEYFLDKVYLEYEEPELFSVYNLIGNKFLVLLVDDEQRQWLKIPISSKRLGEVEYGLISIRQAFIQSEMRIATLVEKRESIFIENTLNVSEISEDYLPLETAKLNWKNIPVTQVSEDLLDTAQNVRSDILDIRVVSDTTENHTINIKSLGTLLLAVNDGVQNIAKAYNRKQGKKRRLTEGCSLRYLGNYAGSFGVRLAGEEISDLLDSTNLTPVLKEFFELISCNSIDNIAQLIKNRSFEYSKALRKLLKYSNDNGAALEFSYTTPQATSRGSMYWELDYARNTLSELDQLITEEIKEEIVEGDLISVSTKNGRFGFVTDSEEELTGTIDPSLRETKFTVRCRARICIKKSMRITKGNELEEKYTLIGIEQI